VGCLRLRRPSSTSATTASSSSSKCIEPLGESKSDYEIFAALAERLGVGDIYTMGGKTELDWVKRMFHASDLPTVISWEEFEEKGYYVVPVPRPDARPLRPCAGSPKTGPRTPPTGAAPWDTVKLKGLQTQSGKIEFVSHSLKRF
jgi:anaerobic selenocysteine-containing dehydrogenase